jgi:hypothetical protein
VVVRRRGAPAWTSPDSCHVAALARCPVVKAPHDEGLWGRRSSPRPCKQEMRRYRGLRGQGRSDLVLAGVRGDGVALPELEQTGPPQTIERGSSDQGAALAYRMRGERTRRQPTRERHSQSSSSRACSQISSRRGDGARRPPAHRSQG